MSFKEKMENRYYCENCHHIYRICDCDERLKTIYSLQDNLKDKVDFYICLLNFPKKNNFTREKIKNLTVEIKELKQKYELLIHK